MRNLGSSQRRAPWIFRNNGSATCSNGIAVLLTPMKDSKIVDASKKPKVEKKPNVRSAGQALLARAMNDFCYVCVSVRS